MYIYLSIYLYTYICWVNTGERCTYTYIYICISAYTYVHVYLLFVYVSLLEMCIHAWTPWAYIHLMYMRFKLSKLGTG